MIASKALIADFQAMLRDRWGYIPATSGETWTQEKQNASTNDMVKRYGQQWVGHRVADCSGAFVWAYRQHGQSIYHGSNRIARGYVAKLLPVSEAKPGMAAFKARAPGEQLYDLPAQYRQGGKYYNGDLNDYYHIGLVDDDPRYVLNSQSTSRGFQRSRLADGWDAVACLKAVDYEEGGEEEMTRYRARVISENGKPVNLRQGPSLNAARVCTVPVGTLVDVLNAGETQEWAEIRWGERQGYMMLKFLKRMSETDGQMPGKGVEEARRLIREAQKQLSAADAALAKIQEEMG